MDGDASALARSPRSGSQGSSTGWLGCSDRGPLHRRSDFALADQGAHALALVLEAEVLVAILQALVLVRGAKHRRGGEGRAGLHRRDGNDGRGVDRRDDDRRGVAPTSWSRSTTTDQSGTPGVEGVLRQRWKGFFGSPSSVRHGRPGPLLQTPPNDVHRSVFLRKMFQARHIKGLQARIYKRVGLSGPCWGAFWRRCIVSRRSADSRRGRHARDLPRRGAGSSGGLGGPHRTPLRGRCWTAEDHPRSWSTSPPAGWWSTRCSANRVCEVSAVFCETYFRAHHEERWGIDAPWVLLLARVTSFGVDSDAARADRHGVAPLVEIVEVVTPMCRPLLAPSRRRWTSPRRDRRPQVGGADTEVPPTPRPPSPPGPDGSPGAV